MQRIIERCAGLDVHKDSLSGPGRVPCHCGQRSSRTGAQG
jgi:hypothetical protein